MPAARSLAPASDFRAALGPCALPSPGVSSTHGRPSNWGAARKAAQPPEPSSPSPMLAWRSRLLPSGVCESLRCRQPSRSRPTRCSNSAHHRVDARPRADVIAGRQQVAGVQAHAEALLAAGGLDQLGELLEAAPERPAGAGRVLQVQRTVLALGQRLADRARRPLDRACRRPRSWPSPGAAPRRRRRSRRPSAASRSATAAICGACRGPRWRS